MKEGKTSCLVRAQRLVGLSCPVVDGLALEMICLEIGIREGKESLSNPSIAAILRRRFLLSPS